MKKYDGNEKVDMTFKELHEAKDNYFRYGYQHCMEDMIRNFIKDLDDILIIEDFKSFLSDIVRELEEKENKYGEKIMNIYELKDKLYKRREAMVDLPFTTDPKNYDRIDEIAKKIKKGSWSEEFINKIVLAAKEYEGMFDLMELWDEEEDRSNRDDIMGDLGRCLNAINRPLIIHKVQDLGQLLFPEEEGK